MNERLDDAFDERRRNRIPYLYDLIHGLPFHHMIRRKALDLLQFIRKKTTKVTFSLVLQRYKQTRLSGVRTDDRFTRISDIHNLYMEWRISFTKRKSMWVFLLFYLFVFLFCFPCYGPHVQHSLEIRMWLSCHFCFLPFIPLFQNTFARDAVEEFIRYLYRIRQIKLHDVL